MSIENRKSKSYSWLLTLVLGWYLAVPACMSNPPVEPTTSLDNSEIIQCPACPIVAEMQARGEAVPLVCSCGGCGDGVCASGENTINCPADCGPSGPVCGNGICESGETASNCSSDCHAGPVCGNLICEVDEITTCPTDCCPQPAQPIAAPSIVRCPDLP